MNREEKRMQANMDSDDLKIEKGEIDPPNEGIFYPKGVLNILGMILRAKKFQRPRGKASPTFSIEEVRALTDLLFFKSPNVVLKTYERVPRKKDMPIKRKMFVNHFLGNAKFNAAKAARMAGYSPKSAKQIAYKIKQS